MQVAVHTLSLGLSLAYLIETATGLLLVDAGSPGKEGRVMKLLADLNRSDLKIIFITHAHLDHYGSAAALRRLTGAKILIHEADAAPMANGQTILGNTRGRGRILPPFLPLYERFRGPEPTPPDMILSDGDPIGEIGHGARLLHTPGHTIGSSCLLLQEELAFVGDLMTNHGQARIQRFYAQDWQKLEISFQRLQRLNPNLVYPGHGREPVTGDQLQSITPH